MGEGEKVLDCLTVVLVAPALEWAEREAELVLLAWETRTGMAIWTDVANPVAFCASPFVPMHSLNSVALWTNPFALLEPLNSDETRSLVCGKHLCLGSFDCHTEGKPNSAGLRGAERLSNWRVHSL